MGMSITNTNHISHQEITAIANCNLDTHLLVIKTSGESKTVVTLAKTEVTFWQLFLRFFGYGKLSNVSVGLENITTLLNRYNWAAGASMSSASVHHQAYLKTCVLANKSLYYKHDETLLNNVATTPIQKSVEFVQYRGAAVLHRHNVEQSFNWNPCMQAKHIKTLLAARFPDAQISMLDRNLQMIHPNANATRELIYQARITLEERLPVPQPAPTRRA